MVSYNTKEKGNGMILQDVKRDGKNMSFWVEGEEMQTLLAANYKAYNQLLQELQAVTPEMEPRVAVDYLQKRRDMLVPIIQNFAFLKNVTQKEKKSITGMIDEALKTMLALWGHLETDIHAFRQLATQQEN